MELLQWQSGAAELALSAVDGRIVRFSWKGEVMTLPAERLFALGLRDASGNAVELSSSTMAGMQLSCEADQWKLSFANEIAEVTVSISRRKSDGFLFRTKVTLVKEELRLEWIDSPQVVVNGNLKGRGGEGVIFSPINEGMLIDDPRLREEKEGGFFAYKRMGYPNTGSNGYYPGSAQMQFLAYYHDRGGVYFGAHDDTHTTKGVEFESLASGAVRLSLQTFCGGESTAEYAQPFDVVLAGFDGDWRDAAAIYREWAQTDRHLPPRLRDNPRLPDWFADSPVTLIYAVRGDGDDKGVLAANEYFPYVKALPVVERYAEALDSRIMALLMHWEGTAPWAPPYVWPPFGGEEALAEFRDRLHERQHLLGVYCSGTAWTQTSSIIDYSREAECEQLNLRAQMSRGPKGEIDAFICNGPKGAGQRRGFDCCIAQPWTQETVCDEVMKLADFGIDYAQYFDQNLGGSAHFCYSRDHRHPEMPGKWQTEAMLQLTESIEAGLRARSSQMIIGCEAAAAQPYMKNMLFSDLRYANSFWFGAMPVPAYGFVFHEYVNNFMGNQNGFDRMVDCEHSPENLLFRTAYSFIAGDMLSVMLKDHGDIHWCWVMKWDRPAPEQEPVRELVRNLNAWRRKAGKEYLLYGRMEKPFCQVQAAAYRMPSLIAGRDLVTDSVLSSAWRAADDSCVQFLANFMPQVQTVTVRAPEGARVEVLNAEGGLIAAFSGVSEVMVPALQAVMLKVAQN